MDILILCKLSVDKLTRLLPVIDIVLPYIATTPVLLILALNPPEIDTNPVCKILIPVVRIEIISVLFLCRSMLAPEAKISAVAKNWILV